MADITPVLYRYTIHRLTIAQAAMRLAFRTAHQTLSEASSFEQTPDQVIADWHVANALVDAMFRRFDMEVANALAALRNMLAPR